MTKPVGFNEKLSPLRLVASPIIHTYIIENMPQDIEISEFISTQLINNPFVAESTKDLLFDIYGYDYTSSDASYITPYIAEKLYNSAMDVQYGFSGYITTHSKTTVDNFLRKAISSNLFPESIQIDLVNRIISEEKEKGSKKMNNLLELFTSCTHSPKVLHIIFEQAPNIHNRDDACKNLYASPDDLKKQADIYYNKIKKMIEKNTPEKILDKWIEEIDYALNDITLSQEQYDLLANSKRQAILSVLVSHSNTPQNIICQIIKTVEDKLKEGRSYAWETLLFKAKLHAELSNKDCCNQQRLESVLNLFYYSYRLHTSNTDFNTHITLDRSSIYRDNVFYKNVITSFKNVFDSIDKSYAEKINRFLHHKLINPDIPEYLMTDNIDKVDIETVKYRLARNVDNFRRELRENNAFAVIEEHANRHAVFSKAIDKHSRAYSDPTIEINA